MLSFGGRDNGNIKENISNNILLICYIIDIVLTNVFSEDIFCMIIEKFRYKNLENAYFRKN
ncbi:hypothetical protein CLO_0691 [Clostridium botulinum E1 str. 'BoNT E Beluga']|nr:hypothetical protein CLO_0691 [Clostridium botulinum E1 str. 'BoNT E Beluga']